MSERPFVDPSYPAGGRVPEEERAAFAEWAIVELMGHVRIAGRVSEERLFGAALGRIDIPTDDAGGFVTQYFGGGSVYRITPVSEELARSVARANRPEPVRRWELPISAMHDVDDADVVGERVTVGYDEEAF